MEGMPVFRCGSCAMADLECMNRERMDGCRCCQHCDGHGFPLTEKGRAWLAEQGHPDGDGITLIQLAVQDARRGKA